MSTIETGPAPKRGRPPKYDTISETKRIRLRTEVYDRWNEKKRSIEHCHKTHSEFAEFLLDICDGYNDIESRRSMATGKYLWICQLYVNTELYHTEVSLIVFVHDFGVY